MKCLIVKIVRLFIGKKPISWNPKSASREKRVFQLVILQYWRLNVRKFAARHTGTLHVSETIHNNELSLNAAIHIMSDP
jgi:hypothetical protein